MGEELKTMIREWLEETVQAMLVRQAIDISSDEYDEVADFGDKEKPVSMTKINSMRLIETQIEQTTLDNNNSDDGGSFAPINRGPAKKRSIPYSVGQPQRSEVLFLHGPPGS
nr:uncharacterized protein LOC109428978 [Aedes albopictus]